ncbi:MAG: hypothetical protein R3B72_20895 [Polyangiaceae bacterium]
MRLESMIALGACLALLPPVGCGDHGRLEKDPTTSAGGGGAGMGGDPTTTTTTTGAGGVGGVIEPPGPTTLTVVNGVVDSDAVRLCFLAYPDPQAGALPWPGVEGLPFARGAVIDPIAPTVPSDGDVEIRVVGGDLSATGGQSCDTLSSSPPAGVSVVSVGVLPASVFAEEKSLLVATTGCVGGVGHTDAAEEAICGPGYSESTPTAGLVAGFMSRLGDLDRVPMQFVHASTGLTDTSAVRVRPGSDNSTATIAVPTFSYGAIAPFPPFVGFSVGTLLDITEAQIQLIPANGVEPFSVTTFAQAFDESLLSTADVEDGHGLTFVGMGAAPSAGSGSWWHAFTFTAFASSP